MDIKEKMEKLIKDFESDPKLIKDWINAQHVDYMATKSDWEQVGKDMESVMSTYSTLNKS